MDTFNEFEIDNSKENDDFQSAAAHVQTIAGNLDNKTLLQLYGHYKQALEGNCNTSCPSWYDFKAKSKWEAWNNLSGMMQQDAKQRYVELVKTIDPKYTKSATAVKESWVVFSTLKPSDCNNDEGNDIVDFVKASDYEAVTAYMATKKANVNLNRLDQSGLGLIHWASDRGADNIIKVLLDHGADVNFKDNEGQSPLHYASSCGHLKCIELLLKYGGDVHAKDNSGLNVFDVACDDSVKNLIQEMVSAQI